MVQGSTPFGMLMPGRKFSAGSPYRYGFNGKENDNEVKGEGAQQDYGFRIYDPRLGKFLSVDPITKEYAELTPYQFSGNSPLENIDIDGLEPFSAVKNKQTQTIYGPYSYDGAAKKLGTTSIDLITFNKWRKPVIGIVNSDNIKSQVVSTSAISRKILDRIYDREGRNAHDVKGDGGGLTKYGIAKNREWADAAKLLGIKETDQNLSALTQEQADKYYLKTRLEPYSINELKSEKLSYALFDQSIVTPGIINKNLKATINELGNRNYKLNNNKLTKDELQKLNSLDQDQVLSGFLEKQKQYYNSLSESKKDRFLQGWLNRLDSIKTYKPNTN